MKVYESHLSYAALSSLSINKVLDTSRQELREKYTAVQEVNKRSNSKTLLSDLALLKSLDEGYGSMMRAVEELLGETGVKAVLMTLKQFISQVTMADIKHTTVGDIREYIRSYQVQYEFTQNTVVSLIHTCLSDLNLLYAMLEQSHCDRNSSFCNSLATKLNVTVELLTNAVEGYLNNSVSLEETEQYLPQYLTLNKKNCSDSVEDLTKNIRFFVDSVKIPKGQPNSTLQITLQDVGQACKDDLYEIQHCMEDYSKMIKDVRKWCRTVREQLKSNREKLDSLESATDYHDVTTKLSDNQNVIKELNRGLKISTLKRRDIYKHFEESTYSKRLDDISSFVSHITNRILHPLKSLIDEIKTLSVDTYDQLFENEISLQKYIGNKYNSSRLRKLTLWDRPRVTLRSTIVYASDRYHIGNMSLFVRNSKRRKRVVKELLRWCMEPLLNFITRQHEDIRHEETKLKALLSEARDNEREFQRQLTIGDEFIR